MIDRDLSCAKRALAQARVFVSHKPEQIACLVSIPRRPTQSTLQTSIKFTCTAICSRAQDRWHQTSLAQTRLDACIHAASTYLISLNLLLKVVSIVQHLSSLYLTSLTFVVTNRNSLYAYLSDICAL